MSNVLIVGSGGREHALAWKLAQGKQVSRIYTAPGNGGTSNNVPIQPFDFSELSLFASRRNCLTLVGPEQPLAEGIVDIFTNRRLAIVGPNRKAAILEASKIWAKKFMERHGIKTAPFRVFQKHELALEYIDAAGCPLVVKADGLAGGKGVFVCTSNAEAKLAINKLMLENELGGAGRDIVIEEFLQGEEVSYIVLSDGRSFKPLATSQDHKRLLNGDVGPNTGGMGAYSPAPVVDDAFNEEIANRFIRKTIDGMRTEGRPFVGFLYAGLIIANGEPYILEFNVRSGDPETQAIMMRLKSDLYPYLGAVANGSLNELPDLEWRNEAAVCVVMTAKGYPGEYQKGNLIAGLEALTSTPHVQVFHAGTSRTDQGFTTSSGRVLGITALGSDISQAISNTYDAVAKVRWNGCYYRTDIGKKALERIEQPLTKAPRRIG